jgi:hypothetical protein
MELTANRPSPLRVATVIAFYMFAALVVCRFGFHSSSANWLLSPDGLCVSLPHR